jgi:hypothetical protein
MKQYTLTYHASYGDRTDVFVEDSVYNAVKEADRRTKPLAIECRCTLSVVNDNGVVEVLSERKQQGVWTRWA